MRALHEHGLRVILGVGLGIPKHHWVEVFGPEHSEAPDHDGNHENDEAIAEALLRGPGPSLNDKFKVTTRIKQTKRTHLSSFLPVVAGVECGGVTIPVSLVLRCHPGSRHGGCQDDAVSGLTSVVLQISAVLTKINSNLYFSTRSLCWYTMTVVIKWHTPHITHS